ncbi:MAG: methyltransferase domain-containing protein [Coriobacteriales bacterium]|jgi:ubiquinone/menaquinone biosynthesis C-methylase UbiE|nr:methyltransferase domain-containing protein [Coriobacteriales bacterium]
MGRGGREVQTAGGELAAGGEPAIADENETLAAGGEPAAGEARDVHEVVGRHYAEVARSARPTSCCPSRSPKFYDAAAIADLPLEVLSASRGCADPHSFAHLKSGERVLDLGCGAGIDCLLAAREVGEGGEVVGLDMTPEMLDLARNSAREAGFTNVRYVQGYIEELPFASASFDLVISNCVINLSPDKPAVLREAFRVLRPGGRFVVADIIALRALPEPAAQQLAAFLGCTSGVLLRSEYERQLRALGFADVTFNAIDAYHRDRLELKARRTERQAELMQIGIEAADSAMAGCVICAHRPPLRAASA